MSATVIDAWSADAIRLEAVADPRVTPTRVLFERVLARPPLALEEPTEIQELAVADIKATAEREELLALVAPRGSTAKELHEALKASGSSAALNAVERRVSRLFRAGILSRIQDDPPAHAVGLHFVWRYRLTTAGQRLLQDWRNRGFERVTG